MNKDYIEYAQKYLSYYGYVDKDASKHQLEAAVPVFQSYFGLTVDGWLGPKTFAAMQEKRCGVRDTDKGISLNKLAAKWGGLELTYTIDKHLGEFSRAEFKDLIDLSWANWEKHTRIRIRYTDDKNANILYTTGSGKSMNFDGPGGVLGWAQLPRGDNYKGQLVTAYDEGETWRPPGSTERGILALNVITHEDGHLLGLGHSQVRQALMAPYYNRSIVEPQQNDDVVRIVRLYGENESPTPTPTPTPNPAPSDLTHVQLWVRDVDSVHIPNFRVTKIR